MTDAEIIKILPVKIREVVDGYQRHNGLKAVEEIRLRCNKRVLLATPTGEIRLAETVSEADLREAMEYISGYSLYAYEEQLKEGFITIRGGHRVGVAGKMVMEKDRIKTIKNISSVNIRISRQIIGCSDKLMPYLHGSILIISPPRMGKTTLLRDILRNISEKNGEAVGIVDERSEIAACYQGIPQNDLGTRADVLDCCPKSEGMMLLLRAMSPTCIGVDELGGARDIEAVKQVMNAGAAVVATLHGESLEAVRKKKSLAGLFEEELFDTYVEIKRGEKGNERETVIYNKKGERLVRL